MMRLLHCQQPGSFILTVFDHKRTPPYVILSHRWGSDEVTFEDLVTGRAATKAGGYKKLKFCSEQAARDGYLYFWIDTCCIDKTNSTELSDAINSMFKWYKNAVKCYVYLQDVLTNQGNNISDWETAFRTSKWFTRGWTLQELIAPTMVEFFSANEERLGDKESLQQQIHEITGIAIDALKGKPLSQFDKEERLSWAAKRQTTVEEDTAYCLLGIFDTHMSLIYGEGQEKALARLHRKIQKSSGSGVISDAPWIVPFERNPYFTGRDDLLGELSRKLFAKDHTSKIAVTGLGGVGKTQLVLELLYRTREKHKHCLVMWISAVSTESLHQGYLHVVRQLGIPGIEDDKADVKKLVQDHLSKKNIGKWLLVFDNADDIDISVATPEEPVRTSSERLHRFIDYLPQHERGCIIFTTRDKKTARQLASAQQIFEVPEMSEEMALELLTKHLISPIDNLQDAMELLTKLTFLPLAIVQATAYINKNKITLADYSSLLEEKEEEVIDILSEGPESHGSYQQSMKNLVTTTWLVSFDQIRRQHPLAAEYLSFMACIDPRGIPQSLLPPGPSRKMEVKSVGTLIAYSFISRRPIKNVLDLHRLVHLATRNWLQKENLLTQLTEKVIMRLEEVFPNDCHKNRSLWRAYLPHACTALESTLPSVGGERRVRLMLKYGRCLYHDGRWNEAEAMFDQILKTVRADHPSMLASMANLALTYRNQGRLEEAEKLEVQIMETYMTKLGVDHPDTLISMANLASTYRNQGRLEETEKLEVQVMETYMTKLGVDHPDTLTSMANLASTYRNQGRMEEAEKLEVQVIETCMTKIWEQTLAEDHPDRLASQHALSRAYKANLQVNEAVALLERVAEIREQALSEDHPDRLASQHALAQAYKANGQVKDAVVLLERVLEIREQALAEDHPDRLASQHELARVYQASGQVNEAVVLLERVLEIREQALTEDHPDRLASQYALAQAYKANGQVKDAVVLLERVLEIREQALAEDHPDRLASQHELARVYQASGQVNEAVVLLERVLEIREQALTEDHPDRLASQHALAQAYKANGQVKNAVALLEEIFKSGLGPERLQGHTDLVCALAFFPDGLMLASASRDHTVRLWNLLTSQETQKLEGHCDHVKALAISPDGLQLASASNDRTVRLWITITGKQVKQLDSHTYTVSAVTYSPDGLTLALGGDDGPIRLWNSSTSQERQWAKCHNEGVTAVVFSPDGSLVASASADRTVRLWDSHTGQEVRTLNGHRDSVNAVVFSPDGSLVASASADRTVRLWDSHTGQEVRTLNGHRDSVNAVVFSPDGSLVASASADRTVRLWDSHTGQEVHTLNRHTDSNTAVTFSNHSSFVAAGSRDNTVRMWYVPKSVSSDQQEVGWEVASDTPSDVSEVSSAYSLPSLVSDSSKVSIMDEYGSKAVEHLAALLIEDPVLSLKYEATITKLGRERFYKSHDRLLKAFFKDLRDDVENSTQLATVRSLRNNDQLQAITHLVYKAFEPRDSYNRALYLLRDEKPNRKQLLENYLSDRTSALQTQPITSAFNDPDGESSDEESGSGNSSHNDDQPVHPNSQEQYTHLNRIEVFVTGGGAFARFQRSLEYLLRPPADLTEALESRDVHVVQRFLRKNTLPTLNSGYDLLHELSDSGYSNREIAELLLEDASDSPWIYFTPQGPHGIDIQKPFHVPGCAHNMILNGSSQPLLNLEQGHASAPVLHADLRRQVEELCGIGGIIPHSRDMRSWNGKVTFEERSSHSIITYASDATIFPQLRDDLLIRLSNVLTSFCAAAAAVQLSGFCCDSFTVLVRTSDVLELRRIELQHAKEMAYYVKLALQGNTEAVPNCVQRAEYILQELKVTISETVPDVDFHYCALATQFLCAALLSYIQGHVGPIDPFFLDTPQREMVLLGSQLNHGDFAIHGTLFELTCLAEMIQQPVFAFCLGGKSSDSFSNREVSRYDVLTNAEDLLDTWGPGYFIYNKEDPRQIHAVGVAGGFVSRNNSKSTRFHWTKGTLLANAVSITFDQCIQMRIGAAVKVNEKCCIDEITCRRRSFYALEPLGTRGVSWEAQERQGGSQCGQYLAVTYNQTWKKIPGITLKQRSLQQPDWCLIHFLEQNWGLQVSFCTSVARRVSLRELVADLLPAFINPLDKGTWEKLFNDHDIIQALMNKNLFDWLYSLSNTLQVKVLALVRTILEQLEHTGFDRENKTLVIAWPQEGDIGRGLKIPCEAETCWAQIIADAEDCATFAYVTPKCLETNHVRCRGNEQTWQIKSKMLVTEMSPRLPWGHISNTTPSAMTTVGTSTIAWKLEDRKAYYIKKLDCLLRVKVERSRPPSDDVAHLVVASSALSQALWKRLLIREEEKKHHHIREKQAFGDCAELVVVRSAGLFGH